MENSEPGHSVQAVAQSADGSFVVDEEAVGRVVSRAETRGLPVAVVAVAGTTRGGKSFLLDFFLRYLHATAEARENGRWIGADDEPLRGFSWRGGSERDTNGILIWSEPIIVTQELNGRSRQIAVILMDTQGTFDNASTVRDCTTIFAMSTLLSSVQIYNLGSIIKGDDLQHLQLFTQYGKLACSASESKPFQSLVFRVRDWMFPYQQNYGVLGGEQYLRGVLEIKENQQEELRELREDIRGSFESISCVLMPYPGSKVTHENFSGRICELEPEFVESLKEFVLFLFSPKNIIAKSINGQELTTDDLLTCFRTYMAVFNSGELPTPVSILKATGEAILEVTSISARNSYHKHMHRATQAAVPRAAVSRLHAAGLQLARDVFTERRMLVTPVRQEQRLQELLLELEGNLPHYVTINEEKLRALFAECEAIFEDKLCQSSCLTPTVVVRVHREAVDEAMVRFDEVLGYDEGVDEDSSPFLEKLRNKFPNFEAVNANRIRNVIIESKAIYERVLLGNSRSESSRVCVSPDRLERRHRDARVDAERYFTDHFTSERNADNQHREELLQYIETRWSEISMVNATNNNAAVRQAVEYYNATMNELFSDSKCVHPSHLESEHTRVRELTVTTFNEARTETGDEEEDIYTFELNTDVEIEYKKFEELNGVRNEEAVMKAHQLYKRLRNLPEGIAGAALAVLRGDTNFSDHDEVKCEVSIKFITEYRRDGNIDYPLDIHLKKLNDLMDETNRWHSIREIPTIFIHGVLNAANTATINEMNQIIHSQNQKKQEMIETETKED